MNPRAPLKKSPHHRQSGLAGLELLIVLVIICLIGGIGSYLLVSHRRQTAASNSSATSKNSKSSADQSTSPGGIPASANPATASNSPATTGKSGQDDFPITEANLQISLPSTLADLTYHVATSGSQKNITFSTKSLSATVPACSANRGQGAFDTIIRAAGRYQPPANPSDGGLLHQYDSYYIAYRLPVGPCAQNLSTSQQRLLDDQAQAFYGSLGSVRPLH